MSRTYYITITNESILIGLCLLEYALKTTVGIKTIDNAQSNIFMFVYYLFMVLSLTYG